MIQFECRPHRSSLRADTPENQKLFLMLKILPNREVAEARPPLAFVLVVDTSGSMSGDKLEQAITASHRLLDDSRVRPDDQVCVIHFDDAAGCLLPLGPVADRQSARQAVDSLRQYSGGTMMARGMELALSEVKKLPLQTAKRVLLLTDGETGDEDECRQLAGEFRPVNAPIVAMGIGETYNESLLIQTAEATLGRPYHLQTVEQLGQILDDELGSAVREVVTDIRANIGVVKGVALDSVTRVIPSLAEVALDQKSHRLGNAVAGEYTVFVFEFSVSGLKRPPSRARLLQVQLTAEAPGLGKRQEYVPQDVLINFTTDESAIAMVDAEVLGYVQQKNVDRMVQEAVQQATVDAGRSRQTLRAAIGMTQRLGNAAVTQMLQNALDELNKTGTISAGTRKTVALGGKTKTMRIEAAPGFGGPRRSER